MIEGKSLFIFIYVVNLVMSSFSNPREHEKMNTLKHSASTIFALQEDDYFSYKKNVRDMIVDKLRVMFNDQGVALGSPSRYNIANHECFPFLWAQRGSGLRSWRVETIRNSFLVLSDVDEGSINIFSPYAGRKRFDMSQIPLSSDGSHPEEEIAEGTKLDVERLDLRLIMGRFLKPSRYAITLIQYDWISNTIQCTVIDSKSPPQSPTPPIPATLAREIKLKLDASAQSPTTVLLLSPSTKKMTTPASGIILELPEKVTSRDSHWLIHGIITIPLAPGALVEKVAGPSGAELPAAIINALLLVSKLDNEKPIRIPISLPLYASSSIKAGDQVSVSFTLNLKLYGIAPAQYQICCAAGDAVSEAYPMFVTQ